MSSHLPILREIFPGKIFLDVDDIAQCLNISKGHLRNLSSRKELPFKMAADKVSNRIQVSIVEMARFLDSKVGEDVPPAREGNGPLLATKKIGRPRTGKVTRGFG
jgi:hypothetical protein